MKTFLAIFLIAVVSAQLIHAQTIETVVFPYHPSGGVPSQDINVPAGQVFELLTWSTKSPEQYIRVDGADLPCNAPNPFVVAGPRTVTVRQLDSQPLVFSYRLKVNGEVATANVATQVVVIPENATAPADIILESSTDLIDWTAAVAGSYSPSTSNRFFRVRLVTH